MWITLALLVFALSGCANWSWDNLMSKRAEYERQRMMYEATQPIQQSFRRPIPVNCYTNYYGNQATTQCFEQ